MLESLNDVSLAVMASSRDDVQALVGALFTVVNGIQRATRHNKQASALALLWTIGAEGQARPSEIAEREQVHPSHVTRQIRELENQGYVTVKEDPTDRRAWLVSLTPEGMAETRRLQQIGLDRFALFVAEWDDAEVQQLTALLEKFTRATAAVAEREQRPSRGRRSRSA